MLKCYTNIVLHITMKRTFITAQISDDFYKRCEKYCHRNQISISDLIRKSVMRELDSSIEFEVLAECEKLIERKLADYKIIDVFKTRP